MPTIDTLWITVILVFVSLIFWYFSSNFSNESQTLSGGFFKGVKFLHRREYQSAYESFISLRSGDNGYYESRYFLTQIDKILGRYSSALQHINNALDSLDLNSHYYVEFIATKGSVYQAMGIFDLSIKSYQESLSINSTHQESLVELIKLFEITSNWNEAIELSRYVEIESGGKKLAISNYYCSIAEDKIKENLLEEAYDYYKKSLRINNTKRSTFTRLLLLRANKDYSLFQELIALSLNDHPELVELYITTFFNNDLLTIKDELIFTLKEFMIRSSDNYNYLIMALLIEEKDIDSVFYNDLAEILFADSMISRTLNIDINSDELINKNQLFSFFKINNFYECSNCKVSVKRHYWQCLTCFSWESVKFKPTLEVNFQSSQIHQ